MAGMEPENMLDEKLVRTHSPSTFMLSMDTLNYNKHLLKVMETFLVRKKGDAVYVTFNKPANSLADLFKDIDQKNRLLFLDVISTHTGERTGELENAFFVSFPGDLTGLMVVLSRMLKMHDFRFLFLDSLSSVLIYNDERTTTRFLYALSAMCKQHYVNLVLFSSKELPETFATSLSSLATAQMEKLSA